MKVLLVTDQYVEVRSDGCYCNFALLGTLKNISVLGDIYIVASKQTSKKRAAQPINQRIDFISADRVWHTQPIVTSLFDYLKNKRYNRRLLKRIIPEVDMVIGYTPGHCMHYAYSIAKRHEIPYMSFIVGCPWDTMHHHQRFLVRVMAPLYYLRTKRIVKQSDYVHYVTNSFLQKRYPSKGKSLGCSDVHLWEQSTDVLERRIELLGQKTADDLVSIVTIAHVDVRYKGQEYVIRALARLAKQNIKKYHYYLIGDGAGHYLRQLSVELNVEDNVHFVGRKTTEEVRSLLAQADIYIQPSLTEGLPRAVVEAMSMALPCIGFNAGGIPELITPEFIVPKKDVQGLVDKILTLENVEIYKKAAIMNSNIAKQFDHSILTSQIQHFFTLIKDEVECKCCKS